MPTLPVRGAVPEAIVRQFWRVSRAWGLPTDDTDMGKEPWVVLIDREGSYHHMLPSKAQYGQDFIRRV